MSTGYINIQIDKGKQLGRYKQFYIERDNWNVVCKIPIHAILNDCTDTQARQGKNHYGIGAEYTGGVRVPDNYYADTLKQDRKYFRFFQ